jgi:hypothetical protein
MQKKLLLAIMLLFSAACKTNVSKQTVVYTNDFESKDLTGIANGFTDTFNNTTVLGRYNSNDDDDKGYFRLTLNALPKHDLVTVSFDLYIHDSWDGNNAAPDGPDLWQMLVDGNTYVSATFSNSACSAGNLCAPQSYPLDYPNNYNNPKTGAYRKDLPGVCHLAGPNGTTQYKITKTFKHSDGSLVLECSDKLVQSNTEDKKCDESWSVDNIKVQTIAL